MGRCKREYYVRIVGKKDEYRMRIGGADRIGCENSWNMREYWLFMHGMGLFMHYEFVQVRILVKNMHWHNQYSLNILG